MIAFSKEAVEADEPSQRTILMIGSQIVTAATTNTSDKDEAITRITESVAAKIAREHQELDMLQRALVRCGLIGPQDNME